MAFSLPMIHSDLSGFADLPAILIQRGIYICLGLGLIFLSVQLINRLEQSRAMAAFSIVAAVVFLALASGLVIKHLQKRQAANNLRMAVKERYSAYADRPNVRVTACDIHLEHLGHEIKVVSTVSVKNSTDKALENLFFTLNPALKVGAVLVGDRELPFERDHQFVIIHEKTSPGDEVQLTITYQGRIDEKVAYPDVDDEQYNLHFRMNVYNVDRKYAFLTPDYVLLTREVLWYPSAWLPFDRKKAVLNAGQFTDFSLVVKSPHGLLPISQGKREVSDTDEFTFVTRQPLVQLSLVMGHYREESLTVDSIEYGLAVYEDHDYFRPFFTNLSDTLPHLITELKQDYERELGLEYPYDRFTLVEVPVQFVSHHRIWTEAKEVMQPQMSFFPEKGVGINTADFDFITNRIEQQNKQRGGDMTPTELEAQVFRQFVNGNLTMSSSEFFWGNNARRYYLNSYSIFPSYYSHTNYVYSEDWSFFNRALESYLWRKTARRNRRRFNADPQMNASQALQNKTFEEILAGGEIELINDVIDAKSEYLFKMIEIDIAEELDIDKLISTLVDSGRFRVSDMVLLKNTYQKLTGADLGPLLDKLLKTEELPGYLIADIRPLKFKEGDYTRYLVSFRITNTREVEGIVEATFYSGGGRGRGEGFRGSGFGQRSEEEGTSKLIRMGPGQTREVSVRLDSEPGAMALNTFISANLPGNVRYPLDHFEETSRPPAEVNRVTEHRVSLTLPNEIVVDNEDKGFSFDEVVNETPLRAWVTNLTSGEAAAEDEGYVEIRWWRAPNNWTPAISSWFYGGEVRSAHF
ncbi:MAG: hypothetical protein OEX02_19545, partial [Cyclobacteriaceae bacterium]|nr:hypothetical protein [Cyclobacteriaceae bacterium]